LGEVKNNKPHGWGKLEEIFKKNSKPFCTNIGKFTNGRLNGLGYIKYNHPLIKIGYFKNGLLDGSGRVLYGSLNSKSKDKNFMGFEGEFKKGKLEGYGIEFGTLFSKFGRDKNGLKIPQIIYRGEWKFDYPNGKGINYYEDVMVCDGNWRNNRAHGECTIQFYGKDVIKGIWRNRKLTKKISEIGNPETHTRNVFSLITKSMENQN